MEGCEASLDSHRSILEIYSSTWESVGIPGNLEGREDYLGSHRTCLESIGTLMNQCECLLNWRDGKLTWAAIGSWESMQVVWNL